MAKYPELSFTHKFLDMTREEQMHEWWKKLRFMYDLDKEKYFYDLSAKSGDPFRYWFF